MNTRVSVAYILLGLFTAIISAGIFTHDAEAQTEQLSDTSNNNLMISMDKLHSLYASDMFRQSVLELAFTAQI